MLLPSISLQWLVKSFSSSARRTLKWSIPWGLMQKIRTWNRQNTLSCIYPSGYQEFWYRYIINTSILSVFCSTAVCVFKHEYLQSRAFICLSLSSPPSSSSGSNHGLSRYSCLHLGSLHPRIFVEELGSSMKLLVIMCLSLNQKIHLIIEFRVASFTSNL